MAKHKAPTQVILASTQEETALSLFVQRHWKNAALFALGITALILGMQILRGRAEAATMASWDRLRADVSFGAGFLAGDVQVADAAAVAVLADELAGEPVGAWARAIEVGKRLQSGEYEGAEAALSALNEEWPEHFVVTASVYPESDDLSAEERSPTQNLAAHIRDRRAAIEAWEAAHPLLFENPALPSDAPRVRLETSRGAIVLGLYSDRAPGHVENFLKHCREGFYDGTNFHRVMSGFMIQGGDPNSRDGEPETWGQGGTDYTQPAEIDPQLRHFRLVLSAAKKPGEEESSGSQFFIATQPSHHLDGVHTVFGQVLEGAEVVELIETGAVVGDRPQDPVFITSTEVL